MAAERNGDQPEPAPQEEGPDEAAVQEYGRSFRAWQVAARKVLAAQNVIDLAGGYDEAFVLVDAVFFSEIDTEGENGPPADDTEDGRESEYGERMRRCEAMARKVLAAQKLIDLAGGHQQALLLLDAVVIATKGDQAHHQAAERHTIAGSHHKRMAEEES
jgi:hypothetical protein